MTARRTSTIPTELHNRCSWQTTIGRRTVHAVATRDRLTLVGTDRLTREDVEVSIRRPLPYDQPPTITTRYGTKTALTHELRAPEDEDAAATAASLYAWLDDVGVGDGELNPDPIVALMGWLSETATQRMLALASGQENLISKAAPRAAGMKAGPDLLLWRRGQARSARKGAGLVDLAVRVDGRRVAARALAPAEVIARQERWRQQQRDRYEAERLAADAQRLADSLTARAAAGR